MSLGKAVIFSCHEQGCPEVLAVVYDPFCKTDGEDLRNKLISLTGILDTTRYTRDSYKIIDVSRLHHEIALGVVDKDTLYDLARIAPEVYEAAKKNNIKGSLLRVTTDMGQCAINRKYFDNIKD